MSKKHEPGMAYNMEKLHKVFAFFSVALLITVVWVFLDDYIRPWKAVQVQAMKIKKQKIAEQVKAEAGNIDQKKVEELKKQVAAAKETVATRKEEIAKIKEQLKRVGTDLKAETIVKGRLNGNVAALGFNWGVAHSHKDEKKAATLFAELQKNKKLFADSSDRMKDLQSKEKQLNKKIADLMKEQTSAEKSLKGVTQKLELLRGAEKKLEMGPIFVLRNMPFIDFLDPTIKVQQVVLSNITDDRYFQHVPKVDRCMTCHTFIDQMGYEDQENPFKTHPNIDLMVGANSTHPMKQFGCTTCHGGEGHRVTDFNAAAHIPATAEQKKMWEEKYHWHEPHKVPIVQFKKHYTEAGCVKCHTDTMYLPQANKLNEGKRNIEKFGCYGCHKIEGWEHKRKPGPSLEKIASKVDKEFFKNWVWYPKSFNKHAKMPAFFNQMNNSDEKFMKKNITEVNAITEFVFDKSKAYKPFMKYRGGNKKRGKKLVKDIGCMSCHGVEDFPIDSKKVDAYKGPYLTGIGSKVSADWLVSWLKKPSHYQEDTIMPSFRLTDREANDITAYLMSLKNEKFDALKFEKIDDKLVDELLVDYFSAFDTIEVAKKKLASMSKKERVLELGYRSVGKYGCYSCHTIDGFDGRAPIGPELSKIGSKPLTQFGFSHEYDVEHTRDGWIKAHLLSPRRWDNGVDKPFKDLLRMPNFEMTEKEADSITLALIGHVSDKVPLAGVKRLNANEAIVAEGMKVVERYNCIGCHQIDGMFGDITPLYEDDINLAPPRLVGQGHRVQSDWFHHFLDNVYPIRPWFQQENGLRMPSFKLTNEEKNKIVALFQAKSNQKTFEANDKKVVWMPGEKAAAKKLFKELDCASCHTTGFNNETPSAPDLHYAKRRLRPSWMKKWLKDPQAILPGTVMPAFWEDGESMVPDVLGGDSEKQMDALVKYLIEIGQDKYSPKAK